MACGASRLASESVARRSLRAAWCLINRITQKQNRCGTQGQSTVNNPRQSPLSRPESALSANPLSRPAVAPLPQQAGNRQLGRHRHSSPCRDMVSPPPLPFRVAASSPSQPCSHACPTLVRPVKTCDIDDVEKQEETAAGSGRGGGDGGGSSAAKGTCAVRFMNETVRLILFHASTRCEFLPMHENHRTGESLGERAAAIRTHTSDIL
jgi:hypothetical protein